MRVFRAPARLSLVLTLPMVLLLVALAMLQHRWIGQVSLAESQRMRRVLDAAADRIAGDFDREITRAFLAFRLRGRSAADRVSHLDLAWEDWRETSLDPSLLAAVYEIRARGDGDLGLQIFDPVSATLEDASWTPALAEARARIPQGSPPGFEGPFGAPPFSPLLPRLPGLLIPAEQPVPPWSRRARTPSRHQPGWILLQFDSEVLQDFFFPTLAETYLGGQERDVSVAVFDRKDPPRLVWSDASSSPAPRGDVERPLFAIRPFAGLQAQGLAALADRRAGLEGALSPRERRGLLRAVTRSGEGVWLLVLTRAEGSLEAAASRLRHRNLAISSGILLLLAAAGATLLVSSRRAQDLARQQMEFVTGVTHELHTPLAALRSAGDNLADGLISEGDQVKRYGRLVQSESRRLWVLVSQVLDYAGMRAGQPRYRLEAVDLGSLLEEVLADHAWTLEEKAFTVSKTIAEDLSPVVADPEALRRVLHNLIGNALKYGEEGRWLGLTAEAGVGETPEVVLRVQDRGPGIPAGDKGRIFDPFYRGREFGAGYARGAGLGLTVSKAAVEAFGGRLSEDGTAGEGACFVVRLVASPAAPSPLPESSTNASPGAGEPGGQEPGGRKPGNDEESTP